VLDFIIRTKSGLAALSRGAPVYRSGRALGAQSTSLGLRHVLGIAGPSAGPTAGAIRSSFGRLCSDRQFYVGFHCIGVGGLELEARLYVQGGPAMRGQRRPTSTIFRGSGRLGLFLWPYISCGAG